MKLYGVPYTIAEIAEDYKMKLTKKIFPELRNCLLLVTEYKPYTIYLYVDENLKIRYYDYTSPVMRSFAHAIANNCMNHNHWVSDNDHDASEVGLNNQYGQYGGGQGREGATFLFGYKRGGGVGYEVSI